MSERKPSKQEEYAAEQFNTRSLMEAYNAIADQRFEPEFAQEYEQEAAYQEEGVEDYLSGALMATYAQAIDAYREGTIEEKHQNPRSQKNR